MEKELTAATRFENRGEHLQLAPLAAAVLNILDKVVQHQKSNIFIGYNLPDNPPPPFILMFNLKPVQCATSISVGFYSANFAPCQMLWCHPAHRGKLSAKADFI